MRYLTGGELFDTVKAAVASTVYDGLIVEVRLDGQAEAEWRAYQARCSEWSVKAASAAAEAFTAAAEAAGFEVGPAVGGVDMGGLEAVQGRLCLILRPGALAPVAEEKVWVGEVPGGDCFAHGESDFDGGYAWRRLAATDPRVAAIFEAVERAVPAPPDKPAVVAAASVTTEDWAAVVRGLWAAAEAARSARDLAEMARLAHLAMLVEHKGRRPVSRPSDPTVLRPIPEDLAGYHRAGQEISEATARAAREAVERQLDRCPRPDAKRAAEEALPLLAARHKVRDQVEVWRLVTDPVWWLDIPGHGRVPLAVDKLCSTPWPAWATRCRAKAVISKVSLLYTGRTCGDTWAAGSVYLRQVMADI